MSVYGGFGTRLQETQYSGLVCSLISLLSHRISAALKGDYFDGAHWLSSFSGVYKSLRRMETQKYQQPKYSQYCQDLILAYRPFLTKQESTEDSAVSTAISGHPKEWEAFVQQDVMDKVAEMLVEESKIPAPKLPAFRPDNGVLKQSLRPKGPISPSPTPRGRQLSIKTPTGKDQPDPLQPRSVAHSRLEELSESSASRKRRKPRRLKLAEIYQDRGYTRLLTELHS